MGFPGKGGANDSARSDGVELGVVGTQLCRHGTKIQSCLACHTKKRACPACGRIRYNMRTVYVNVGLVENRFIEHPLILTTRARLSDGRVADWVVLLLPACDDCWRAADEAQRLEYVRSLWLQSNPGPEHLGEWFEIEAATLRP